MTTQRVLPKQSPSLIPVVVGAVLVAAASFADTEFHTLGWFANELGPAPRSTILGAVWVGAAAYAWIYRREWAKRGLETSILLMLGFLAVALVSSLRANDPGRAIAVWFGFSAITLLTMAATRKSGPDAVLWGLLMGAVTISVVSGMQWLLGPDSGRGARYAGISFEPNLLGQLSGLAVIIAMTMMIRGRLKPMHFLLIAGVMCWVAYLSGTRTTWPALGAAVFVALATRRPVVVLLATVITAISIFGLGGSTIIAETAQRSETEELSRLSGRVELWEWTLEQSLEKPFVGNGLGSGIWTYATARTQGIVVVNSESSHNIGLEIVRETGLIGLLLMAMAFFHSQVWRSPSMLPLLAYLCVSGLTMPTSGLPGLIFVAWILLLVQYERPPCS